jgi:chromosome partitioning protein
MNILAIANNKGGVGKTTSAQNIGAAIGIYTDRKVLIVDLDEQANLSKGSGVYLERGCNQVGKILAGRATLEETIIKCKKSSIDILPASIDLIEDEVDIKKNANFPFTLLRVLEKTSYDFIVIDCPPTLSYLTKIALVACQRYYVPLQAEYFSYEGLRVFINYANQITTINPRIRLGGVFASRFNPHIKKNFSRKIIQSVGEQLQDKFLKTYIRENIALTEAQAKGQHIFEYDKHSNGAIDYYNLTKEIILR